MNAETFDKVKRDLLILADSIATAKRPGYTQANVDVLHNFKTTGARCGITPLQAWAVHFEKHCSAIMSFAKDPNIPQAENITGRFADAVNYLELGLALIKEES